MDSSDLIKTFREEMRDESVPPFWSDGAVLRYADEAQKTFCRLTDGIEDSRTPAVTQLSIVPGQEWYVLSPLICKLRMALRADTGDEVPLVASERLVGRGIRFDGRTGPLAALVMGLEKHAVRAWPVPSVAMVVNLSVFRLPLRPVTREGQRLEIDEQHHEALLLWMKSRAYGVHDADSYDGAKASEYEQKFRAYCFAAKAEQTRARRPVGAVAYGGL